MLTPVADRLRVPLPVLLTVYGLCCRVLPGMPVLSLEPDLILPLVLPPLLFAATQRATVARVPRPVALDPAAGGRAHGRQRRRGRLGRPSLAGLGWGAAWVLGAVVAPPDPVAATAVARRLRLPPGW